MARPLQGDVRKSFVPAIAFRHNGGVSSTDPSQSPGDILRRIQELQAAGPFIGHVTDQHVISRVLLRRFAEPWGPDRALLIRPFRLAYPSTRHQPVGPDGCGKVDNFVNWASASVEQLWKETEDRLPDALAAMDAGTLLGHQDHITTVKAAIALHFARSKATLVVHTQVWADTVARGRERWLTENRQLLASWFYQTKGLFAAGDEALGRSLTSSSPTAAA